MIIIYQHSWQTGRAQLTEVSKSDKHLQAELEGGSGELQACQSDLHDGQGYRGDHPSSHHTDRTIRPSQRGFMKGRFCLTNLISSYDKVTRCMREKLRMFSPWTSERLVAQFLTAFS